jgi:hypothetical protein
MPNKAKEMYASFEEPLVKSIRPQNPWNVDGTGVINGIDRSRIFIGPTKIKEAGQSPKEVRLEVHNRR